MRMQRGYSLVEAAIVLVVFGLVIGGALVPIKQRFDREAIKSTEELLYEAKGAVYHYAMKHHTAAGHSIIYYDGMVHRIPAGRPYLPCPDVTGDGREDRTPMPGSQVRLSVDIGGGCQETKGLLPWKTLGLRGTDSWGNRLIYRVDERYSSRLLGFDETFSADVFDLNARMIAGTGGPFYATVQFEQRRGAVICTEKLYLSGCPSAGLTNVVAGVITTVDVTLGAKRISKLALDSRGESIPGTGIMDGIVFVILSHGKEDAGAITNGGQCRPPPGYINSLGNDLSELTNSYYHTGHPFLSAPFNCTPAPTIPGIGQLGQENVFVDHWRRGLVVDRLSGHALGSDDILVWSGRYQLLGYLARNGAFPIPKLGHLPQ